MMMEVGSRLLRFEVCLRAGPHLLRADFQRLNLNSSGDKCATDLGCRPHIRCSLVISLADSTVNDESSRMN